MHIICAIGLASLIYFDGASVASTTPEVDAKEAELYISLPHVDFNTPGDQGVLKWCKSHQSMIPNLTRMARQFLVFHAASTEVERLFSASGEMHGAKRKRLKEEALQSLLYVNKIAQRIEYCCFNKLK
jgi:hypothetical protein